MEFARHVLLCYALLSLLISGGLLFNAQNRTYQYLGVFVLVFAFETLDFLYVTSPLLQGYPPFYMLLYPICLLAGPVLWFHLWLFRFGPEHPLKNQWFHFIPFIVFTGFTVYLFRYHGTERLSYVASIYETIVKPLNYLKAIHVFIYAVLILRFYERHKRYLPTEKKQYFFMIMLIYLTTAVLVTVLTAVMVNYTYFIYYFLSTAVLSLFVGYVLYYKPHVFARLRNKYAGSYLDQETIQRITNKINVFFEEPGNILNPQISLNDLSIGIAEKKHWISQVLSAEMKTNFNDFVNEKRIGHAKKILENPEHKNLKILAVALESGFTNKSTFYRSFLKFAACSPSAYRNKKQVSNN